MKLRKELWFGFSLMGLIVIAAIAMLVGAEKITNGHIGLLMLSLVVVAIMLGFPTAFTLMGMGMIFTWIAYEENTQKTLDLMVASAFKVMSNDVLISIPLFVFMGYLVERANLIEKLFKSLHLALVRLPGALADAAARIGADPVPLAPGDPAALAKWARAAGASQIATAYVTTGPLRDWLDEAAPMLAEAGISLCEWQRAWDRAIWPHATAGFFKVKQAIPRILAEVLPG